MRRHLVRSAVLGLVVAGCSVHVSTGTSAPSSGSGHRSSEATYLAAWTDGIEQINEAASAMGACDVQTGDAQQCLQADKAMRAAVDALRHDLEDAEVPPSYERGDTAMKAKLRDLSAALELRDDSITSKDRDGLHTSLQQLAQIHLEDAAALYPQGSGITVDRFN